MLCTECNYQAPSHSFEPAFDTPEGVVVSLDLKCPKCGSAEVVEEEEVRWGDDPGGVWPYGGLS